MRKNGKSKIKRTRMMVWMIVLILVSTPLCVSAQEGENVPEGENAQEPEQLIKVEKVYVNGQDSYDAREEGQDPDPAGEDTDGQRDSQMKEEPGSNSKKEDTNQTEKEQNSLNEEDSGNKEKEDPSRNDKKQKDDAKKKQDDSSKKQGRIALKGIKNNALALNYGQKKKLRVSFTGKKELKKTAGSKNKTTSNSTIQESEKIIVDANWCYQLSDTEHVILQKVEEKKNGKKTTSVYLKAVGTGSAALTISAKENGEYKVEPLKIQITVNQAERIIEEEQFSVPVIKKWKYCSDRAMELTWEQNRRADGYQIQYSSSRTFARVKTVMVNNGKTTKKKIQGLKKDHIYYARIRAFLSSENELSYSEWSVTENIRESTEAQLKQVKEKNSVLELRRCAGDGMGQYDTVKAACTDGTCAYYLMTSKSTEKCKILKVSLDTSSRVGVSDGLNIQDGSDMTYDSERGQIVLCYGSSGEGNQVSYIAPDTLKIISEKTIHVPDKLNGSSGSDEEAISGFNGIAYSAARKEYVAMIDGNHHLLILNKKMEPVKMVKTSKDNSYQFQGIDATDDYILTCMSPDNKKQKCSRITIYDWDGNRISTINVKNGYELESIYHAGNQFYATFFCKYYRHLYKTVGKKVKINGEVVTKKVKKRICVLQKNNFVYRLGF